MTKRNKLYARPGSPPRPLPGKAPVIDLLARIFNTFAEHGHNGDPAVRGIIGNDLRATVLMPRVIRRAEYLQREAKRLASRLPLLPYP